MPTPLVAVHRLSPERRDDFLRFFDHRCGAAFSDNPEWAKCYCHFYHVPREIEWSSFDAAANRTAMAARIDTSEMEGFLAYAGSEVVGWLNAQPKAKLSRAHARLGVPPDAAVAPHRTALIVCFIVAPEWRRRGVARALLDGALASLAVRGFTQVDAFPFKAGASSTAQDHYHGPASLFRATGFEIVAETDDLSVMRKRLGPRE